MSDITKAAIWAVIIGAIGVVLLGFAGQLGLPTGFGLFDMSQLGVRVAVFVILVVGVVVLAAVFRSTRKEKR